MNKILLSGNTYRCRLCLKVSNDVINIFREDFAKMIKLLTTIQVERTDQLPKVACISCTRKVKAAIILRQQIIRSYRTLMEEAVAKRNKTIKPYFNTKTISDDSSLTYLENKICKGGIVEKTFATPEIVLLDVKKELKIKQEEVVPIHIPKCKSTKTYTDEQINNQLNDQNVQNLPSSLNKNEISIVKINKPKYEEAKIAKISAFVNNTGVQIRRSPKRQSLNFALIKTNIQASKRKNPKISQPPKRRDPKPKLIRPRIDPLTPVPCKICEKSILHTNMKRHVETHDKKMVTCHLCGKITKNTTLRAHIFYFHKCKEDEYVCDQCGRHFRYRHRFNLHMKKAHGGTKDFECTICGRKFFERRFLTTHIDSHHKKIRPFVCDYCGKDFSTKHVLKVHLRQHTESAPYSCDTCGLRFKQKVSLKTHRMQAHDICEEATVFCEVCGKGFGSMVALASHFRLHERKKCVHCPEVFVRDDYLERHIKDKHGIKSNYGVDNEIERAQIKNVNDHILDNVNENLNV